MKLTFAVFIGLLFFTLSTRGQGTVWFNNNPSSLVSVNGVSIPPEPETFYFGLFTAPPGTTDRNAFVFTGNYATNASHFPGTTGRFIGGIQAVQGWLPGQPMDYLVRGWESAAGHDWDPNWLSYTGRPFLLGESSIAHALFSGGDSARGTYSPWVVYGGTGLQGGMGLETGINMRPIPEPATGLLTFIGAAWLLTVSRPRRRF